ncbi:hypothetical protein VCHENC02_5503B, partial [Vibrio harveyi]|jgi:T-complex protein 1 subunit beta
LHDR